MNELSKLQDHHDWLLRTRPLGADDPEVRKLANTLAVLQHPELTSAVAMTCAPSQMTKESPMSDRKLYEVLLGHPVLIAEHRQQLIELLQVKWQLDSFFDAALAYCLRADTSFGAIAALFHRCQPNSEFRTKLGEGTQNPAVNALLNGIKAANAEAARKVQPKPKPKPAPPPAPPPAPAPRPRDLRLAGSWAWSDSSSSSIGYGLGSFSASVYETFVFFRDGRFVRRTQSFAGTGGGLTADQLFNHASPDQRGRWDTINDMLLILRWDDGDESNLPYYIAHGAVEIGRRGQARVYLRD